MKLHSIVDIITNSSSVIYTYVNPHHEKIIYNAINNLLESIGIDKTAEELFDIKISISDSRLEELEWEWNDSFSDEEKQEYNNSFEAYKLAEGLRTSGYEGDDKIIDIYDKKGNKIDFINDIIAAYDWEGGWNG